MARKRAKPRQPAKMRAGLLPKGYEEFLGGLRSGYARRSCGLRLLRTGS
jgi:hypothetical protein